MLKQKPPVLEKATEPQAHQGPPTHRVLVLTWQNSVPFGYSYTDPVTPLANKCLLERQPTVIQQKNQQCEHLALIPAKNSCSSSDTAYLG